MTHSLDGNLMKDVALGSSGAFITVPASYAAMSGARSFLDSWGLETNQTLFYQFFHGLNEAIGQISNSFLRGALKATVVAYPVIVVPMAEEWFFRGLMYSWQEDLKKCSNMGDRICRVMKNAVVFGAFHLSLFHGWANVPIFLVVTISGVVYAGLREWTKNWRASFIAHSLSNAFVLTFESLRI